MVEKRMWYEVIKHQRYVDVEIIEDRVIVFTWDGSIQINVYAAISTRSEMVLIDAIPVGLVSSRDFWRSEIGDKIFGWVKFYEMGEGKGMVYELVKRSLSSGDM